MGTWGSGILDDDFSLDVYDACLDGFARGDGAAAIVDRLRAAHAGELAAPDVDAVFWLAIAHAQRDAATVQPETLRRVTAIVEQGLGLEPWTEAGGSNLRRRKAALTRFLASLTRPAPRIAPATRTKAVQPLPDFDLGDCLAVELPDGRFAGVVVTRNKHDSTAPSLIVSVADVTGPTPPEASAFVPLRWHIPVPDRCPNHVVKYEVYPDGLARHRRRYRRVCRLTLGVVPEPLVLRPATWGTLWKRLPDAFVRTP